MTRPNIEGIRQAVMTLDFAVPSESAAAWVVVHMICLCDYIEELEKERPCTST